MRTFLELAIFTGLLTAALCFNATTTWAKPEYARRTQKECSFCHPPDSWNLNDAGKYYRDHKYSLQGYKPPAGDKQHKS
jgi:hypothetical protein